jgi:hypothetical protein
MQRHLDSTISFSKTIGNASPSPMKRNKSLAKIAAEEIKELPQPDEGPVIELLVKSPGSEYPTPSRAMEQPLNNDGHEPFTRVGAVR